MQYHSEFNHHRLPLRDRTPWFVAETNADPGVVDVFRRYATLRERLVPYLAEQAGLAIDTGSPLMRGLFFDHASDPRIWEFPGEFQLGDALLIHPVTAPGASTWSTYLPVGNWVDVWTGESLLGGRVVERDVPHDVVPVYARADQWTDLAAVFGH
jgi:alpha-glucosidase (family GH31 glycosyl hydrolase)